MSQTHMHGFILLDKPDGPTSHDVVNRVRRLTGERRVGHAGTLDPFATGLLIVGVGRTATREFQRLVGLDKEYEAVFALGATSDTDDRTGKIDAGAWRAEIGEEEIRKAMRQFVGAIEQLPPAYSAIKVGGKKLYELARAGKPVERKPRPVTVHAFELAAAPAVHGSAAPFLRVRIRCSSGTYVRSLARDLGEALGTGGYVEELRRTAVGPFRVEDAVRLDSLRPDNAEAALADESAFLSRLPASARVNS